VGDADIAKLLEDLEGAEAASNHTLTKARHSHSRDMIARLVRDRDDARDEVDAADEDAEEDAGELEALSLRVSNSEARALAAEAHVEALQNKIDGEKSCCCAYDTADAMCAFHSPRLVAAEAALATARDEIERLKSTTDEDRLAALSQPKEAQP
jgi:predicted  nucleic acid-binding Zn-ribbon protein